MFMSIIVLYHLRSTHQLTVINLTYSNMEFENQKLTLHEKKSKDVSSIIDFYI